MYVAHTAHRVFIAWVGESDSRSFPFGCYKHMSLAHMTYSHQNTHTINTVQTKVRARALELDLKDECRS